MSAFYRGSARYFLYRWHSGASDYLIWNCHQHAFVIAGVYVRPQLLPEKNFPGYAYLPGKYPHPVRNPLSHSYQSDLGTVVAVEGSLSSYVCRWGIDLFNHRFFWEAYEAWELLWHARNKPPSLAFSSRD